MPPITRVHVVPALAVLALAVGSSLSAQTVSGTVVDSETSQPLAATTIELLRDSRVVAQEQSDNGGNFRLPVRGAGPHWIRVQRIGYNVLDTVVQAGDDITIAFRLVAMPVPLGPLGVTAETVSPYLQRSGFYERRQGGAGTFLDPATVEKYSLKAKIAADILDNIPGVNIMSAQKFSGLRVPQLRGCRSAGQRLAPSFGPASVAPAADSMADDLSRWPRVYVDGVTTGMDVFGSLQPTDILAVEVYMGAAQIPLQYGGTDAPCGVIMIWTKR